MSNEQSLGEMIGITEMHDGCKCGGGEVIL